MHFFKEWNLRFTFFLFPVSDVNPYSILKLEQFDQCLAQLMLDDKINMLASVETIEASKELYTPSKVKEHILLQQTIILNT